MTKRFKSLRSLSILSALVSVLFMSPALFAQSGEPVKIGVIIGLTGPNAVAGNDCLKAMQIAVEEINQAGGVLGRPLELIVEDNEGRPKAGVEAANKLADVDKVPVVVGAYSSGIALPVGQALNKKKVVFVTDATTNKLKTVGPYLFNTAGIAEQAVALVDFVKADKPDAKNLGGLFMNNPIGQDRAAVSEQRAKELGLEWASNMLYQVGAKDFRAELQQLMDSKPDAILTDIYDNDAQIIQRQLFEMGVTDMSLFYSYNLSAFATLDPKLMEGMKGLSYVTAGPRAQQFTDSFVAQHGKTYTDAWAPPFYDAMWIVAKAINMAHSLDSTAIRNAMWPAAYHHLGVSGQGDKGFNQWGMQHGDQNAQLTYVNGEMTPYYTGGSSNNIIEFKYADAEGNPTDQGIPRHWAPTEEEFKSMYSDTQ
ncbi:MAG: ABC transporter substrate-binding protein [Gammaproteobacteria bacterium]|nr:ABC transporter substrate-binding protein [Gammaproteobacteria bacterium]